MSWKLLQIAWLLLLDTVFRSRPRIESIYKLFDRLGQTEQERR